MKYLFFVQGEGRGHLSQALTLKEKLEKHGHQIVGIIVGINHKNDLPQFFEEQIDVPLFKLASPGFSVDKKNKGIKIIPTIFKTLQHTPLYLRSLQKIKQLITDLQPDVLVNFYEVLAGNYYRFYSDKRPLFSIGHQYLAQHPTFKFPPKQYLSQISFKLYNHLTAPKRSIKIALSFTNEQDLPKNKLFVCPPLIRKEIKNKTPKTKNFLLIYILNPGYSQEIIDWSNTHPQTKIEAFWSKSLKTPTINFSPNLTFNYLSGEKFIDYLTNCQAYASTAGFDSISEAAYLQKNILMVPTKHHFEQKCNAYDAQRAQIALTANSFNLELISNKKQNKTTQSLKIFKNWVDNYDNKIVKLLEKYSQKIDII